MSKWTVLIALSLAMFILVIDTTIMNVSISTLIADFDTTVTTVQGVITMYALVMAAFMITGGKLGDIWGRLRTFRRGLVVYGIGSLITALSPTIGVLFFGWSILEGLGAVLVMPALQTLVTSNYDGADRALAYGVIGGVVASGLALGPIIGGWLTTAYTWRLAFAAEVIIVILVLGLSRQIQDAPLASGERPTLDLTGTVLSALGMASIVYGILLAGTYGWWTARTAFYIGTVQFNPFGLSPTPIFIGIGLFILLLFLGWERRLITAGQEPLVHISLLRQRTFTSGMSIQIVQTTIMGGVLFAMSLFFQIALGLNAMQTGFLYLPLSIPLLIASLTGARLAVKVPPRRIIQSGLIGTIAGLLLIIAALDIGVTGLEISIGFALLGIGVGLMGSQIMNLSLSIVSPERTSEAAALMSTSQNLGMSLGTALLGAMLLAGLAVSAVVMIEESTVLPDALKAEVIASVEEGVEFMSDEQLNDVLQGAPPDIAAEILRINEAARIKGIRTALWAAVIAAVLGLIPAYFLPKRRLIGEEGG
jgi:MFS family permease